MKATPPPSPNFSSSPHPPPASPLLLPSPKKNPLSVSGAWPYSKTFQLATKHPNAPALLCLRDPPACAGHLGRAPGTPPKSPCLSLASQRCCPGCCASSRPCAPRFGGRDAGVWLRTLPFGTAVGRFSQYSAVGLEAEIPVLQELGVVSRSWGLTPPKCPLQRSVFTHQFASRPLMPARKQHKCFAHHSRFLLADYLYKQGLG